MNNTDSLVGQVRYDFSSSRALVTGGTSGIGLAIANALSDAGARVTVTGTRPNAGHYQTDLSSFEYKQLRLSDLDDISQLGSSFEQLDILVNNAGNTMSFDAFEDSLTINLTAVHRMSLACYPALKNSALESGGSVINIASMMSFFGSPYFPGYGAAKAGIVQLTKTYAAMWAKDGIRTNAIAAGSIETRMTQAYCDDKTIYEMVCSKTPMGCWGQPEDIADSTLFLSSSGARFITGHTLVVDGGYSIIDV